MVTLITPTREVVIPDRRSVAVRATAWVAASHPGPCLAVTGITVVLAATAGSSRADLLLLAPAVLAGQLSVGWSNDAFDAGRDAAAARSDKPIVTGMVSPGAVAVAAAVALVTSVLLCLAVGRATAIVHLVMMAAAWAYNAGLKATLASGLMYVVGFAPIPALAASTLPGHPVPRLWTLAAAALLGLGAHFANVLPDLAADQASGVRGMPQRMAATRGGHRAVRLTALVLLLTATVVIVAAAGPPQRWLAITGLALAGLLAMVGIQATGRLPLMTAVSIAAINVALFASSGTQLVGS